MIKTGPHWLQKISADGSANFFALPIPHSRGADTAISPFTTARSWLDTNPQDQFYKSYAYRWVTKDILNDVAYAMYTIYSKGAIKRQAQHFLHNGVGHRKTRRFGSR